MHRTTALGGGEVVTKGIHAWETLLFLPFLKLYDSLC